MIRLQDRKYSWWKVGFSTGLFGNLGEPWCRAAALLRQEEPAEVDAPWMAHSRAVRLDMSHRDPRADPEPAGERLPLRGGMGMPMDPPGEA